MANEPLNGNGAAPQQLSLGPNDKYVLVIVDPIQQAIQTVAPNIADELEVAQILLSSLGSVIQKAKESKEVPKRIVQVAPGTRLRQ